MRQLLIAYCRLRLVPAQGHSHKLTRFAQEQAQACFSEGEGSFSGTYKTYVRANIHTHLQQGTAEQTCRSIGPSPQSPNKRRVRARRVSWCKSKTSQLVSHQHHTSPFPLSHNHKSRSDRSNKSSHQCHLTSVSPHISVT